MSLHKLVVFLFGLSILFGLIFFVDYVKASSLYNTYDLIEVSHPNVSTNHSINFTTGNLIPPSGKIVISFQEEGVEIPAGLDYTDVDFSVAEIADNFIERNVDISASALNDGVFISTGTSGIITIELNSLIGIDADKQVRLKIGTNTSHQGVGDLEIINALNKGVYFIDIKTYDASSQLIDRVKTFIIMIEAVSVGVYAPRLRGNGLPSGTLEGGSVQTIMSLTTNFEANCSYSATLGTDYGSMINDFYSFSGIYHTILLAGLQSGGHYIYYVRCSDRTEAYVDSDDYIIEFFVASTGDGGTGGGSGGGTGSSAGGGGGFLRPFPVDKEKNPSVKLSGWAYPGSKVMFLRDGEAEMEKRTRGNAEFEFVIDSLPKGLYTFSIWAEDSDDTKSITYNSTFWVEEGTQANVYGIILPPTISLVKNSVENGENLQFFGQTIPNKKVEIILFSPTSQFIIINEEMADESGKWTSVFATDLMDKGIYKAKARTYHENVGYSDYSKVLDCGVGEKVEVGPCVRSDLNKDGKVNLIDFSILMYNWGASNPDSDLNQDGKIDLIDFSIMMYCWTG